MTGMDWTSSRNGSGEDIEKIFESKPEEIRR
jgi:hypothetical protein